MKDLILTKNDTSKVATLRVDMLSNSPANITIMEIKNSTGDVVDEVAALGNFRKRLPVGWPEFVAFCKAQNLKITAEDGNAGTREVLLLNQAPVQTKYPILSVNSGTKTIVVATDITALLAPNDKVRIFNADNTIWGTFTHVSDSYANPNTSIVVSETITTLAGGSGKYMIKVP